MSEGLIGEFGDVVIGAGNLRGRIYFGQRDLRLGSLCLGLMLILVE